MKLSAVVLTKNEERNIEACLKSLSFCDEIIVVDDYSEDKTIEKCQMLNVPGLAKRSGAGKCQVFRRRLEGDFAAQRNYGLSKAKGDWVLFVDADERITPKLRREIINVTKGSRSLVFRIRRSDHLLGRELKHSIDRFHPVRLAERKVGLWEGRVHELWNVRGKVYLLTNPLLHYPHETLREFIKDVNFYSTLRARELHKLGRKSSLIRIIIWPLGKFLEIWIWKNGFLDGTRGFVAAMIMSFHSFLAWSKLWFSQN